MPEHPDPGEHHGHAVLVRGLDDLFVPDAPARLDDGGSAVLAASSTPSRNGKKASEAMTEPLAFSPALWQAIMELSTRDICPAPMPTTCSPLARMMALDQTCLPTFQAKSMIGPPHGVGARLVTTFGGLPVHLTIVVGLHQHAALDALHLVLWLRIVGSIGPFVLSSRMFFFFCISS